MYDPEAQNQYDHVRRTKDGGISLRVPSDMARRGIRIEVNDEELPASDRATRSLLDRASATETKGSALSQVLRESEDLLTNVDRVVFAIYFLQKDGVTAISTQVVAAALKAAGQPDVRRLGLGYGQAAAQGLIRQGTDGFEMTPLGSAWVEGWVDPVSTEDTGGHSL